MRIALPRSLFGKLLLAQVVNIVALAVILPIVVSHTLAATADEFARERLAQTAELVAGHAGEPPDALARIASDVAARHHGREVILFDASGNLLAGDPQHLSADGANLREGETERFVRHGHFETLTRLITGPQGQAYRVVILQDLSLPNEVVDNVVASFLARFAWVLPFALLASLGLSMLVIRRVTGDLRRAAAEADQIGLTRLDARIDRERLPSEARPLVNATNRALDRLEAGYHAQGEFIGNVAHELRTPLALLSLHVEQIPPGPERNLLQADIQKANHVVRQLMQLVAIDRLHPEHGPIDAVALAREVVETMVPLVYRADHTIALEIPDGPPAPVLGVSALLEIALTNLIDNAIRHTPAGCAITVFVEADGALSVEDDGPGLAVDARETARRRFRRGDTARSDSAGLGLSIVERIMSICGGTLEVGAGERGGARMTLRLEQAPDRDEPVREARSSPGGSSHGLHGNTTASGGGLQE